MKCVLATAFVGLLFCATEAHAQWGWGPQTGWNSGQQYIVGTNQEKPAMYWNTGRTGPGAWSYFNNGNGNSGIIMGNAGAPQFAPYWQNPYYTPQKTIRVQQYRGYGYRYGR